MEQNITQNAEGSKREMVMKMFNDIAPTYDRLNHVLSLDIDRLWRRRVVRIVRRTGAKRILDLATGTGDLAIDMARRIRGCSIYGMDISHEMLEEARRKTRRIGLDERIVLEEGDAERIPLQDIGRRVPGTGQVLADAGRGRIHGGAPAPAKFRNSAHLHGPQAINMRGYRNMKRIATVAAMAVLLLAGGCSRQTIERKVAEKVSEKINVESLESIKVRNEDGEMAPVSQSGAPQASNSWASPSSAAVPSEERSSEGTLAPAMVIQKMRASRRSITGIPVNRLVKSRSSLRSRAKPPPAGTVTALCAICSARAISREAMRS